MTFVQRFPVYSIKNADLFKRISSGFILTKMHFVNDMLQLSFSVLKFECLGNALIKRLT